MEAGEHEVDRAERNPYEELGDWIIESPDHRQGRALAVSDYGAQMAAETILNDPDADPHEHDEAETRVVVIQELSRKNRILVYGYRDAREQLPKMELIDRIRKHEGASIGLADVEVTPDKIPSLASFSTGDGLQRVGERYSQPLPPSSQR